MKLAWLTDIHLNFLEYEKRIEFYQKINSANAEAILISGDIAEATSIIEILEEMAKHTVANIYFVAGNHDYYQSGVGAVHAELKKLTQKSNQLFWLAACDPIILTPNVVLVGQDGWADGRIGDYTNSRVVINDSRLIDDLFKQKILGRFKLLDKMQELADLDASKLQKNLEHALLINPKKIIVLTHVPPFKEVSQYNGAIANDDWLPFFSSKATGDVLHKFSVEHSDIRILVLCGHTHQYADVSILPNLRVKVGKAEYYMPEVQEVFEF
jgi:predicted phosphohydrolase